MSSANTDVPLKLDSSLADPRAVAGAIQQAIDSAGGHGGGVVRIPPGRWPTTTILLRSGVTLHLSRGATLEAAKDLDLYPLFQSGHNKDRQPYHLILADGCEGITIEGDGMIEGNGPAFWSDRKEPGLPWIYAKERRVSPLIEIRNSRRVVLRDFTIHESPGWTVHCNCCDDVTIRGVTIANHPYGPNNDGLDINGCRDVFISDCRISGCDDNIIIKATKYARSSERIAVSNCILQSNCAALGLGAETAHDIRNIAFSNCVVKSALRIIQIEMWEPGTIENIVFSNIAGQNMTDVPLERPIYIDIQQHTRAEPTLGKLRNVLISNFAATTRGRIVLTAQDGAVLENVTLRDVHLTYPDIEDPAITVPASRSSQMSNHSPVSRAVRSAMVVDNARELQVYNLTTNWPGEAKVPMHGLWCRNVRGGLVDSPYLRASREKVSAIELIESDVCVRRYDDR